MARVLGAVRLSKMRDESTSPERQREQVYTWAKLHGHTVVHVTEDTDVSGSVPATLRPDLGPWLTDPSRLAKWDILVAAKMDRVTRSVADLCSLIEFCDTRGKALVSIAETFDLTTPAGRMVATILASVAQFERERGGERRQEATEALYRSGRWPGGRFPFGYKAEKNGVGWYLVPDPKDSAVVRWMAEQIIAGKAATAVARELHEREVPTPAGGKRWRTEVVIGNLRNPALAGRVIWKGEEVRDADGELARIEPILDEITFKALQTALDANKQNRGGRRKNASLLLRVAFCGRCGKPLYRSQRRRGNKAYIYYGCAARLLDGSQGCEEPYFPLEVLERTTTALLLKEAGDVTRRVKKVIPAEDHAAELASVTEAIEAMQDQLVATQITPEVFTSTVAKLEARKFALEQKPHTPERIEWEETGETFRQYWERISEDEKHAYLVGAGITVSAVHGPKRRRGAPGSYPTGNLDDGHILWAIRNGIELTINLGELADLRDLAATHGTQPS